MKTFIKNKKIYLRDTDATDIVYYSRHLEWFEETRIDFIGEVYKTLSKMIEEDGISFIPINVNIDYKAPAIFEDIIKIEMHIASLEKLKMILRYEVTKEIEGKEVLVAKSDITMLCINTAKGGRPCKIPENLKEILLEYTESN